MRGRLRVKSAVVASAVVAWVVASAVASAVVASVVASAVVASAVVASAVVASAVLVVCVGLAPIGYYFEPEACGCSLYSDWTKNIYIYRCDDGGRYTVYCYCAHTYY